MSNKLHEIGDILKGGAAGAFAAICTYISMVIVVNIASRYAPFAAHLYQISIAKYDLFLEIEVFAGIGFVLGVVFRRRLPYWSSNYNLVAGLLAVLFICWCVKQYAIRVEYVGKMKLTECTNGITKFRITIPPGRYHSLQLRVPKDAGYTFSGNLAVFSNANLVTNFSLDSKLLQSHSGVFLLTGHEPNYTNVPPLAQIVRERKSYDFQLTLTPSPPSSSSLWLDWRYTHRDTHQ